MYFEITGGLYLILDIDNHEQKLFDMVSSAMLGGVDVLGLNISGFKGDLYKLINKLNSEASKFDVPLIVIDEWKVLNEAHFDGVHLSQGNSEYEQLMGQIEGEFILGMNCTRLKDVEFASEFLLDYISINVNSLTRNKLDSINENIDRILFLEGINNPDEICDYQGISFDGIIIDLDCLDKENILKSIEKYKTALSSVLEHY
ncbi:thiamine phosphate synthase [Marinigracilibium pacificum]|nr:thiamine phosphate synthase [Marinigracilibium pacificum]